MLILATATKRVKHVCRVQSVSNQSRDGYGAVKRVVTLFRFDRSMTLVALIALCDLHSALNTPLKVPVFDYLFYLNSLHTTHFFKNINRFCQP